MYTNRVVAAREERQASEMEEMVEAANTAGTTSYSYKTSDVNVLLLGMAQIWPAGENYVRSKNSRTSAEVDRPGIPAYAEETLYVTIGLAITA